MRNRYLSLEIGVGVGVWSLLSLFAKKGCKKMCKIFASEFGSKFGVMRGFQKGITLGGRTLGSARKVPGGGGWVVACWILVSISLLS